MELPDWVPDGVEVTVPSAARMYDFALGGYHNFAVDREFVERAEKASPGAVQGAHANRAFVNRVVRWLIDAGIRQFLDIGSGIPTLGNVHEVAQATAADARVMYVDIDPVAVAHSKAILAGDPHTSVIQADLRRPADILFHPDVVDLLDFSRPVAVLLHAVLHFVSDADDLHGILAQVRDALVSGSYLTITHGAPLSAERAEEEAGIAKLYQRTPTPVNLRTEEEVQGLMSGLDIIEPGVVAVTAWHPDPEEADVEPQAHILAVVGRMP